MFDSLRSGDKVAISDLMKIQDVMSRDVKSIPPGLSLVEVAVTMCRLGVGFLIIIEGKEILGVITDRDVVIRAVAKFHDPAELAARDMMTRPPIHTVGPNASLNEALCVMNDNDVNRLVVTDGKRNILGVVTRNDIVCRIIATRTSR